MKYFSILFLALQFSFTIQAQLPVWEKVYTFKDSVSALYFSGDTILVSGPALAYTRTMGQANWNATSMSAYKGFQMAATASGFYFLSGITLYRFNQEGTPVFITTVDTTGVLLPSGKDVLIVNQEKNGSQRVRRYDVRTGAKTTYTTLADSHRLTNLTANDSIVFGGSGTESGGYYKGQFLNMKTNSWTTTTSSDADLINTVNISDGRTAAMAGKGCYDFYYTDDYGKTEVLKPLPNLLLSCFRQGRPSDRAPYLRQLQGNPVFVGAEEKGVHYSPDLGTSWSNILPDSTVFAIEIYTTDIYVLTKNRTLIKTNPQTITGTSQANAPVNGMAFTLTDNELMNHQQEEAQIVLTDVQGRPAGLYTLQPGQTRTLNLPSGCYFLQDAQHQVRTTIFIY